MRAGSSPVDFVCMNVSNIDNPNIDGIVEEGYGQKDSISESKMMGASVVPLSVRDRGQPIDA